MIGPGAGARVTVATRPVDFRKGPDALAALVGADYGGGRTVDADRSRRRLPVDGIFCS